LSLSNGTIVWSAGKNPPSTSASAVSDSRWHFVAVTAAPNSDNTSEDLKIYLDGQPAGAGANTFIGDSALVDLFIGNGLSGLYKDLLDDLRIYKRALSAADILDLYQALPPKDLCGNAIVGEQEFCDDGNDVDTDDCLPTCQNAACGDGKIQAGVEECDPPGQLCTAQCYNKNPDEVACENAGGGWTVFEHECVDSCKNLDLIGTPSCSSLPTSGCECGESKCWDYDQETCVDNPPPSKGGWNWANE
jgi:cysteine-rich repeat protein